MPYMLICDGHLDLSMNAMDWNRDLRQPLENINQRESGKNDLAGRGRATVCFPEMRSGNIGLCVATLIARFVKEGNPLPGWHSPEQAWSHISGQLAWYRTMEEQGELKAILDAGMLAEHVSQWSKEVPHNLPIGYVLSLEGADSINSMEYLEILYNEGLRALGPAHYGPGTYAYGTDSDGKIGLKGRTLLDKMMALGIILDATHLSDTSFWEAVDYFDGAVWASHSNCRALVNHQRQFSDKQLKHILQRGGIIGVALDAWMMVEGWIKGGQRKDQPSVTLSDLADHIDHICQLAGNSEQVGIGSDLDGGFGSEQTAEEIKTIADLQKLSSILLDRGYQNHEVKRIMHSNWISFLNRVL